MAAPLVKGLIITASILVAAGVAIMENEQLRNWVLDSRRKIAMALHSLGDEIGPSSGSRAEDDEEVFEFRRKRREEIIRLNRLELIRQARQEGVSVDLDELVRLGTELDTPLPPVQTSRSNSFDKLLNADGTLKTPDMAQTSGADTSGSGLRQRGAGARGLAAGAFSNPFDDEASVLFDRELIGAESVHSEKQCSRESSRTLSPAPNPEYFSHDEMEAQIEEAIRRSLQDESALAEQPPVPTPNDTFAERAIAEPASMESSYSSYYYAPPSQVHQPPANAQSMYSSAMEAMMAANMHNDEDADDEAHTPTGALTPTEDGFSTAASIIGSHADDVGQMDDVRSMIDDDADMDARSEATSEAFSMVGASTQGSWTDVESEAGDEEGHHVVQTQTSNIH